MKRQLFVAGSASILSAFFFLTGCSPQAPAAKTVPTAPNDILMNPSGKMGPLPGTPGGAPAPAAENDSLETENANLKTENKRLKTETENLKKKVRTLEANVFPLKRNMFLMGAVAIAVLFIAIVFFLSKSFEPAQTMTVRTESKCHRCGWRIADGETICPNPECRTRMT